MIEEKKLLAFTEKMNNLLDEICFMLEVLVALAIPPSKPGAFGLTGEQKDVYDLCDATMSVDEITRKIGKPGSQVRKTLTRLRRKGLVATVARGKNAYYFRTSPPKPENSVDA